jgi:hypothetical protein
MSFTSVISTVACNLISEIQNKKHTQFHKIIILSTLIQKYYSEICSVVDSTTYFSYQNINVSSITQKGTTVLLGSVA